ncbi:hypothetical protein AYX13_02299 [Cryptococcus neoformans]|nr:hypothetical protein AYX13_02299 [Cryptococcus neoformans var. grubii]
MFTALIKYRRRIFRSATCRSHKVNTKEEMPPARSNKFKTSRFPAARIKRIMQLDEEVGKLASATPVMISKSLECFIQVLLDESCKTVREAGARKLTAGHLKLMINTNPSFDFLRELTESIADLPSVAASGAGPSKARKASTSAAAAAAAAGREGEEDDLPGAGAKRAPRGTGKGKQSVAGIAGKELVVETWAKEEQERLGEGGTGPGWGGGGAPIAGTGRGTGRGEGWTAMPWSGSMSYPPAPAHVHSQSALPTLQPPQPQPEEIQQQQQSVSTIGSWKRDMTGGGGSGEGGRGMFDDYEEDEDDY